MRVTLKLKYLLWAALLGGVVYLWRHVYSEPYTYRATCIDRFSGIDKYGDSRYVVVFRCESGELMEWTDVTPGTYYSYQVGTRYIFESQELKWK